MSQQSSTQDTGSRPGTSQQSDVRDDFDALHDEESNLTPRQMAVRVVAALGLLYLLVCAVGLIGDGFGNLGEDTASNLFDFAVNPFVGLAVGILATSVIQSSSTTTAIAVTAVGSGSLPLSVAIPIIMGANVGTSVTNTLASLGFVGSKREFRRAFSAATVHDFFNLLAVVILLPIELLFHPLQRLAEWVTGPLSQIRTTDPDQADWLSAITDPVVGALGGLLGLPGGTLGAVLEILGGVVLIFLAVRYLGKVLQAIIVGRAKKILHKTVGGAPPVAMGAGALITVLAQSSSVTTSVLVPFAGSGALTTRQIYPVTLGANVGTTATALIAAMAVTGDNATIALQAALAHLMFNLFGILIIYVLPWLRWIPLACANWLGEVAAERKWVAAVWIASAFLAAPALIILVSTLF